MNDAIEYAVELDGINKSFGAVHANRNVNLKVRRGTIHGIVGENGAGKSTLMSILYGFYTADSGEIRVDGQAVKIRDSKHALKLGIGMVHQHFMLIDNFTVLENIVLGTTGDFLLAPSFKSARTRLSELADQYRLNVDPDAIVEALSVGLQQRIEILKALYRGADTLILDEPTSVLTPEEADDLFRLLRTFRAQGKTVILITHKLREIMAITDVVSVMRQGQIVATLTTAETEPPALAELMIGRRVLLRVAKTPAHPGAIMLNVANLTVKDDRGTSRVKAVDLQVRASEIVGIAGVAGNGQSELLEALSGMRLPQHGAISIEEIPLRMHGDNEARRMREAKLAHVPEDRHKFGLVMAFEAWENTILGYQYDSRYGRWGRLDRTKALSEARCGIAKFDIRPADPHLKSANFSGGNQQKLVLSRELERRPKVLIIGQPTRGVDIGAIEFIHREIIGMRDAGAAVLLVSVELDEIRALSDRILIMFDGQIVGEADPVTATESEIGMMMAGIVRSTAQ